MSAGLRIGTLGSQSTFAGQATAAILESDHTLCGPVYFASMAEVWRSLEDGVVDRVVLVGETSKTGHTDVAERVLREENAFVHARALVPYRCALLGVEGSSLADIREVRGHGSILQCQNFLDRNLPAARRSVHRANSAEAGREVLAGNGTVAVIGTESLASELGLAILAKDVDEGSVGSWWVVGERPGGAIQWDTALLRMTAATGDELVDLVMSLKAKGHRVVSVFAVGCGDLGRRDYLVTVQASQSGSDPSVVFAVPPRVLAGAYVG
jgi:prephenate dehydratase